MMFPDEVYLKDAGMRGKSRLFELLQDFRCHSSFGLITARKRFITDGASIPSLLWGILSPFGPYFKAALIHDYLYVHGKELGFSKQQADLIFLEGLKELGVGFIKRYSMYNAVRFFGKGNF